MLKSKGVTAREYIDTDVMPESEETSQATPLFATDRSPNRLDTNIGAS